MKQGLKSFLGTVAPKGFQFVQTIRARRHTLALMKAWGLDRIDEQFLSHHEPVVAHGPFKGMKLLKSKSAGNLLPRILGSYECELHPMIDCIAERSYTVIADVGCAEGYYAVGLARLFPAAMVLAYDLDPFARKLCRQNAALNDVARNVKVLGRCTPPKLQEALRPRSLLVCDCEGYEFELLSPDLVPALANSDVLVELHAPPESSEVKELNGRFEPTHSIQRIRPGPRDPARYPELNLLDEADRAHGIKEVRMPGQTWLFLDARVS